MGRETETGSLWIGGGSPPAHRRIAGSIQELPRIAPGSTWGAEGEHHWIVCHGKAVKNPARYGCRAIHDAGEHRSPMHVEVNHSVLNCDAERSGVDNLDHGSGLSEPDTAPGDPCSGSLASEAIRLEC